MKFVIASMSRCGSTAVYRVLKSDPNLKIGYEPVFYNAGMSAVRIRKMTRKLFRKVDGFKHVWDPNGWPFRGPNHISSLDVLAECLDFVLPNQAVLECADRIVLLRRKNIFDRTISDLWGQQTELWGHNPDQPHHASEVHTYRTAVRCHVPSSIDSHVFDWYMQNSEKWENIIVGHLGVPVKSVFYEDLFNSSIPPTDSASSWNEMADWLECRPCLSSPEVQNIISPESKLNCTSIYQRIPNYLELKSRYDNSRTHVRAPAKAA